MEKTVEKLTEQEIIQKIANRECFVATSEDNAFTIKIDKYVIIII